MINLKEYLCIFVKEYEYQDSWNDIYLADENIFNKGDYVLINQDGENMPVIVMEALWLTEDEIKRPIEDMKKIKRVSSREEYLEYNKSSIQRYILANLNEQLKLPKDFSLNDFKYNEHNIKFADCAIDGITFFHTEAKEDIDVTKKICKLLKKQEKNLGKAVKIFDKKLKKDYICTSLNSIDRYIQENRTNLDPGYFLKLGLKMICEATNPETVKLGLCLVSNFDLENIDKESDMFLLDTFNKMAICEEFS